MKLNTVFQRCNVYIQIDLIYVRNIASEDGPLIEKSVGLPLEGTDGIFIFQLLHNAFADAAVIRDGDRLLQIYLTVRACAAA